MTDFVPSAEQQAVLDHPNAPLRIAAGAGTGKTTTLAHRIGALISQGFEPEELLGVTFTNKAADELAERIRDILGDTIDPGREVNVHTYHGFASQILQEYGPLVGVERRTGIITPTFSRQLFHDSLAGGTYTQLDLTYLGVVDRPARLASDLGDNLRTVEELAALAPETPDPLWVARMEVLGIVARYEAEKARLGVVDYSDLIAKAHEIVTRYPEVATRIRQRYRAVFLDEYQDTNPAQRELLRAVFGDGFPVTAVGDADQTIYEWRGASLDNFASFPSHFLDESGQPAATLPLTINRRSGHHILAVANAIRAQIGDEEGRPLQALPSAEPGYVATKWMGTAMDEAAFLAEEMRRLHDEGTAWSDMAVLFRKNKDIEVVRATLEDFAIPVEVANLGGLLAIPEVSDLHAWLRILNDPENAPATLRVLMGSRYRLGLADVKPLSDWARPARDERGDPAVPGRSLVEAIDRLDAIPAVATLSDQAREALDDFQRTYRRLLSDAQGVNLVELVRRILSATGAWQEVEAMEPSGRLSARLNLYRFLDLAEQWSPLEGRPSLPAFLAYLSLMQDDQTEELDTARLSGENAVALLTVHRAKGLEWDVVFIPAIYQGNFPASSRAHDDPFKHPQMLPYELRLDHHTLPPIHAEMTDKERTALLKERHDRQEWRIAYVAATRARRRLYLTGASWFGHPEPRKTVAKPSPLFDLAEQQPLSQDLGHDDPPERPDTLRLEPTTGAPDPTFGDLGWDGALRAALDASDWPAHKATELGTRRAYDGLVEEYQDMLFTLPPPQAGAGEDLPLTTSVTGLVTYASCPKRFYWTEVDRLPRRPSGAAQRGVEVHRRIELHNRGNIPIDEALNDLYDLTGADASLGHGGPGPYEVFAGSRFANEQPLHTEAPFDLRLGEAGIRGRVDAIYGTGHGWEIVDFKSGRPNSNPSNRTQLQAYALAARHGAFGAPQTELVVTFAYLGGGNLTEISESVDAAWMDEAETDLVTLIESIASDAYDPRPSAACKSCDFARFCEAGTAWLSQNPPGSASVRRTDHPRSAE